MIGYAWEYEPGYMIFHGRDSLQCHQPEGTQRYASEILSRETSKPGVDKSRIHFAKG